MTVATQRPTYAAVAGWGRLPDGWSFVEATAVGGRLEGQRLRLQPRGPPRDRLRPAGEVPSVVGRGDDQPGPRHHDRPGRHRVADRRRQPHDPPLHRRREAPADDRRPGQSVARPRRQAVQPADPRRPLPAERATSTSRTGTATRECTSTTPRAACSCPGASRAPIRAASTSRTTSRRTPRGSSTSRTARTTASRCSTATGHYQYQINNLHRAVRPLRRPRERRADLRRRAALASPGQRGRARTSGPA